MVEQRTLTPLVLVRVQVSQPLQKPLKINGFLLFSRIRENFSVFRRVNEDESLFFQAVFTKTSMIFFQNGFKRKVSSLAALLPIITYPLL